MHLPFTVPEECSMMHRHRSKNERLPLLPSLSTFTTLCSLSAFTTVYRWQRRTENQETFVVNSMHSIRLKIDKQPDASRMRSRVTRAPAILPVGPDSHLFGE